MAKAALVHKLEPLSAMTPASSMKVAKIAMKVFIENERNGPTSNLVVCKHKTH